MEVIDISAWKEFEDKIVAIVDGQDVSKVKFKPYAQTYARHIVANLYEGIALNYSVVDATKTQMLYVISNLEGASEEDLKSIQSISLEMGIDLSEVVKEVLDLSEIGENDE